MVSDPTPVTLLIIKIAVQWSNLIRTLYCENQNIFYLLSHLIQYSCLTYLLMMLMLNHGINIVTNFSNPNFSYGATLYTPQCVCVCLFVPHFVCPPNLHLLLNFLFACFQINPVKQKNKQKEVDLEITVGDNIQFLQFVIFVSFQIWLMGGGASGHEQKFSINILKKKKTLCLGFSCFYHQVTVTVNSSISVSVVLTPLGCQFEFWFNFGGPQLEQDPNQEKSHLATRGAPFVTIYKNNRRSICLGQFCRGEYFPKYYKLFPEGNFQNIKLFPANSA